MYVLCLPKFIRVAHAADSKKERPLSVFADIFHDGSQIFLKSVRFNSDNMELAIKVVCALGVALLAVGK